MNSQEPHHVSTTTRSKTKSLPILVATENCNGKATNWFIIIIFLIIMDMDEGH
jgi:hypothetical protein